MNNSTRDEGVKSTTSRRKIIGRVSFHPVGTGKSANLSGVIAVFFLGSWSLADLVFLSSLSLAFSLSLLSLTLSLSLAF